VPPSKTDQLAEAGQLAQIALIVEDNPDNMLLTKAVMRLAGYRTTEARSAEEALERLQSCTPDVVLMDIQLPGQDGLSLTRQLRSKPEMAAVPIVALTAHAMREVQDAALAAGCDGYITKPIDTRAFASQLAAVLAASQRGGGKP
jgi:CheY-like chemotaxis protein